jgi:uracil-DNA glycosylase
MLDGTTVAELVAVLEWYRAMGADEATGEAPIDWLQRGDWAPGESFDRPSPAVESAQPEVAVARAAPPAASHPPSRLTPSSLPPRQFPATAPDTAVMAARAAAHEAADLDELGTRLAAFDG